MKILLLTFIIMANTVSAVARQGQAVTVKKTFSRQTYVSTEIAADPAIVWALLSNASDYPRWNPTVISIEGNIAKGEKIKLKSSLDPKRTFTLRVKEFEPARRLVWGDGQGTRVYTLEQKAGGLVAFSMDEKIGGLLFPLYAGYIPPFDKAFEQFAGCLKKEAETIQNAKR